MKIIENEIWKPIKEIKKNNYFDSLINTSEMLQLLLRDLDNQERTTIITFEEKICYRYIDEGRRGKTILELRKLQNQTDLMQFSFFKVLNSKYIKLLTQQSNSSYSIDNLQHYAYFDDNCFIDIITTKDPHF